MQTVAKIQMTNLDAIKGAIAAKIDSASFSSWIAPLTFDVTDNTLVLGAQNQFSADFINSVHGNVIASVAHEFGLDARVVVRSAAVKSVAAVANDNKAQAYAPVVASQDSSVAFDAFVASDENLFVLSACKKLAAGKVPFSPLFIYGVAGCGKTLLTECIAGAAQGRVVKMSGAQFVSEFTRSLKEHNIFAFKDFCRNCDTFILDDVQSLSGKKASTDEFLQLVVDLRNAGKNIVLTSNAAPNNMTGFDRRAQSLLASGLVADVCAPNAHVKTVMLQRAGVAMDVVNAIASRIANDGHLIAGVATKIKTYTDLMGAAVDMAVAQRLLADTLQKTKTPSAMVKDMCEKLAVSYDAVCGNGRSRSLVLARQIMMVVLKSVTGLSLTEIGNFVGGRDHATVLYAIKQIEKQQASDLVLSAQIQQLIGEYK
ncbi:MAG: DnaA/Hda family protein [Alphaproteobacteria bacterium]|nr:DnaA/Hda family protein [Alphaproteobacteria bacterium]